jgi:hypothetical protein
VEQRSTILFLEVAVNLEAIEPLPAIIAPVGLAPLPR